MAKKKTKGPQWVRGGHWLDRLSGLGAGGFFADGWGPLSWWENAPYLAALPDMRPEIDIHWERRWVETHAMVAEGHFESPAAEHLPLESRRAHVQVIWPRRRGPEPAPMCVHMASTGDQGYARRRRIALPLAKAGIGTVILENPYYGLRRPHNQDEHRLRRVSDLLAMGYASLIEGIALLGWLQSQGHTRTGVAGLSMGGQMALIIAGAWGQPVATAAFIAPHSALPVFTEGIISQAVCWSQLASEAGGLTQARTRMSHLLSRTDMRLVPPPKAQEALVVVAGRRDAYVPVRSARAIANHCPGAVLRWLDTGHVGGFLFHLRTFRHAIEESFTRLAELSLDEGDAQKQPS